MPEKGNIEKIPGLIRKIYAIVHRLEGMFPGVKFTPDGHMVGGLGAALAAHYYGIVLCRESTKAVDGRVEKTGDDVQIKATQGSSIGIRHNCPKLLVLQLTSDGNFREIYNGNGDRVWREFEGKKKPPNGQFSISVNRLRRLQEEIPESEKIQRVA